MQRRSFLAKVVGVSAAPLFSQAAYAQAKQLQAQAKSADLKITAVELWEVKGDARKYDSYLEDEYPKGGMVKPTPPAGQRQSLVPPVRIYLKITTNGGLEGFYGPHDQNVLDEVVKIQSVVGMDPLRNEAFAAGKATSSMAIDCVLAS